MTEDLHHRASSWIVDFLAASDEDRIKAVGVLLAASDQAGRCFLEDHAGLRDELERLRTERRKYAEMHVAERERAEKAEADRADLEDLILSERAIHEKTIGRAKKAETALALTRDRLDALIDAGFGATTDTLRELRAALDDTKPETP